jgi:putative ABC transport system permease protein
MSTVGDIRDIVSAVSAVIALTIFLIAANSMSMMVRERLRDVAVLRALGFAPPYVARLLLGECALIGTLGGALGCALALWQFGSGTTLRSVLESAGYLTVTYGAALEALAAAIAISVLSAAVPVMSAMRVTPADAFRKTI